MPDFNNPVIFRDAVHMAAVAAIEYLEGGTKQDRAGWNLTWVEVFRQLHDFVPVNGESVLIPTVDTEMRKRDQIARFGNSVKKGTQTA